MSAVIDGVDLGSGKGRQALLDMFLSVSLSSHSPSPPLLGDHHVLSGVPGGDVRAGKASPITLILGSACLTPVGKNNLG